MGGEWRDVFLEDVAAEMTVGHVGPMASQYVSEGVPFLRSQNVDPLRINDTDLKFITAEFHDRLRKSSLSPGDVVIVRTGKPGACAVVPATLPVANCSDLVIVRCGEELEPRFLAYYVNSAAAHHVGAHLVGAVQQHFNVGSARRIHLRLPSLAEQRCISHVLGTLDDKIELNRRMSETLEAMARALFRSWFVDFDPVRAKVDDRDTGLPSQVAHLFPDRLVYSELGEIPEAWPLSRLGQEVITVLGGTPSRNVAEYWRGDIPWINSGKANEFRIIKPTEYITRSGLESSATKMLPTRTTVIAITGATLGQISLTELETCANQSIVGVLGSERLPSEFLFFWTKEHVADLLAWQTGGAQQHINKNNVNDLRLLCPPQPVMNSYVAMTRPAFDRIRDCCVEANTLASLRDTLLPKLISGELRVRDAEILLERTTA